MSGPTLYTADAGQAYEMVAPTRIEKSFCSIFKAIRRVTKKADPLISVIHSTKAKCKFGGFITDKLFDRSVFYLSKIEKSMRALVECRWYRFGNNFIFQKSGIPIGGPVSGAILDGVLSVQESNFDSFSWPSFARMCGISGSREKWLTMTRYVDDVLVISRWFCPCCVEKFITSVYKGVVNFDCSNEGAGKNDDRNIVICLDLWMFCSWAAT